MTVREMQQTEPPAASFAVKSRSPRLRWRYVVAAGVIALVAFIGWLIVRLADTADALERVRGDILAAQDAVLSRKDVVLSAEMVRAREASASAQASIKSIPCRIVGAIPVIGRPVRALDQIADTVDDLVSTTLPVVIRAANTLDPSAIRGDDGALNLAIIERATPAMEEALRAVGVARRDASNIDSALFVPSIDDARDELVGALDDLADTLDGTKKATELLPPLLGRDGSRTYLVAFQTNAELRGTGGLVGGIGLLSAENGKLSNEQIASNLELVSAETGVDFGADYDALYGTYESNRNWLNSNISPHFPYAAQVWQYLWERQSGQRVDGAIAVDPIALRELLSAVGPVTMSDGWIVSSDNVAEITMSSVYLKFGEDNDRRKEYQNELAAKVFEKVVSGKGSTGALLDAVRDAITSGHIAMWSDDPAEQALLAYTAIGHTLPYSPAPYANVVVNNAGANKLDYYLRSAVTYSGSGCRGDRRESVVSVELANGTPDISLPDYVAAGRAEGLEGPRGTNRLIVTLYGTWGAKLDRLTVDGSEVRAGRGVEQGHPVYYAVVDIEPGETKTIDFNLEEPVIPGKPVLVTQPMAHSVFTSVTLPEC